MKLQNLFETSNKSFTVEDYLKEQGNPPYDDPLHGNLDIRNTKVTSLKGCPSVVNGNCIIDFSNISSFEFSPKSIHGNMTCFDSDFSSLKDIHKHIHQIDGNLSFVSLVATKIKSNVLGLMLIKGLNKVLVNNSAGKDMFREVADIINKHLPGGDIVECQSDLIDAGFEEYAKL